MKRLRTYIKNLLKIFGGLGLFLIPLHTAKAFWPLLFFVGGSGAALIDWLGFDGAGTASLVLTALKWLFTALLWIASYILSVSGSLLDWTINNTILNPNFASIAAINVGWAAARDVANLFFIFILLYIAIATILRVNESNTKRMLASVIIVALLMNFSLFFTKVIVDISNNIAIGVYSSLYNSTASISAAFADGINIQRLLETPATDGAPETQEQVVVLFGTVAFYIMAAWVFFNAVFLLLGRFIALIFLMILSPFAFISYILPKTRGLIFDKWFNTLTNQAIVAPLFMFLLLVALQTIQSGVFTAGVNSDSTAFVFNLFIGLGLLWGTVKITRMVAGDIGANATKWGKRGLGILGGAVGGFALRRGAGGLGRSLRDSERMQRWAANSRVGAMAERAANRAATGSYDFRNIRGTAEYGKGGGKGGYEKTVGRQSKVREEQAKRLETDRFGNKNYVRATEDTTVTASYVDNKGNIVENHPIDVKKGGVMPTVYEERDAQGNIAKTFAGKYDEKKKEFKANKRTFKDDKINNLMKERNFLFKQSWYKKGGFRQAVKDREAAAKLKGGSKLDAIKDIVSPPDEGSPETSPPTTPTPETPPTPPTSPTT